MATQFGMDPFALEQQQAQEALEMGRGRQNYRAPQAAGMVGRVFVGSHPLQHMAELLRVYQGGQQAKEAETKLADIGTRRNKAMADTLRTYGEQMTGAPEQRAPMQADYFDEADRASLGGNQDLTAVTPERKADPMAANQVLMQSQFPAFQQMGMANMMEAQKKLAADAQTQAQNQKYMGILSSVENPQDAIRAGVPTNVVKDYYESKNFNRDEIKFEDVGGQKVPVTKYGDTPTGVKPLTKTGNPFSDLVLRGADGNMVPNAPLVDVKSDIAKKGATNVSVNADKSYFGNVAEGLAKQDVGTIDAARAAPKAVETARSIKTLLNDPNLITGTGANARLALNKAFQTAGLIDGTTVANTEQLSSMLANQTLSAIKSSGLGAGNGFTNTDREFLEKASSGQITMDVNTLRRIADINEKTGLAIISKGNSVIKNLKNSGKMGNISLEEVQVPVDSRFRVVRD